MAKPKTKAAAPSKVDLAHADVVKAHSAYDGVQKRGKKCKPKERSVAAAKLNAAQLVLEAERAQEIADKARARADEALRDVEAAAALE